MQAQCSVSGVSQNVGVWSRWEVFTMTRLSSGSRSSTILYGSETECRLCRCGLDPLHTVALMLRPKSPNGVPENRAGGVFMGLGWT